MNLDIDMMKFHTSSNSDPHMQGTDIDRYSNLDERKDKWSWKYSTDGSYNSKSTYDFLLARHFMVDEHTEELKNVWCKFAPLKVDAFSWKVLQDRIPTFLNLLKRGAVNFEFSNLCPLCGLTPESTDHLFFVCDVARKIWEDCYSWFGLVWF